MKAHQNDGAHPNFLSPYEVIHSFIDKVLSNKTILGDRKDDRRLPALTDKSIV